VSCFAVLSSTFSRMLTDQGGPAHALAMNTATQATAVAYYRTSSATNVGEDKDSQKRQRDAVHAYAEAHGLAIVGEYYDAAVSGADPVMSRPGFSDMLTYMLGNGARIVLVENASRFARDLAVQLVGHDLLKSKGISLIPVDAPDHFQDDTPTATMVRSILGAVSQFEKEALVLKLRKARDRKRRESGRCEGNPRWLPVPDAAIQVAKAAQGRGLSLRAIAAELASQSYLSPSGKTYGAESIKRMLSKQHAS
jgi:DNA invertase Pin-like site-specific DNA recombinase